MCVIEIGSSLFSSAGAKMAISGRDDKEGGVIPWASVPAFCTPKVETVGQVGSQDQSPN